MLAPDFGNSRHGILTRRLPLTKLLVAIYLMSTDKGGVSASRLSQMIGVQWRTAQLMQRKLQGDRELQNSLSGLVEVDDGLPEIVLGLNQTIMFGLFMVMIVGSIGTVDLSQEIFRALIFNDGGKGLGIGFCVAFVGLTADRLLVEWVELRKRMYGLA